MESGQHVYSALGRTILHSIRHRIDQVVVNNTLRNRIEKNIREIQYIRVGCNHIGTSPRCFKAVSPNF